jgi:hypothetical protein
MNLLDMTTYVIDPIWGSITLEAMKMDPVVNIRAGVVIMVAGANLEFVPLTISDGTPTAHQIARAAGCKPPDDAVVMRVLDNGEMDLLRPDQELEIAGGERFVAFLADHVSLLRVDGERYEWPGGAITGAALRRLAGVPDDCVLYLQRIDRPDEEIQATTLIDLDKLGIEAFITVKRMWKLNVHGIVVEFTTATVVVRDALVKAGFDPSKPWQIFLKVVGEQKVEVTLDMVVDLSRPGIEKLRLMPRAVDNGEAPAPCRTFSLLEEDIAYLDRVGLVWETVVELERRWLIVRGYLLPAGFAVATSDIALEIPPDYPQAQIYGFYAYPPLALASGRAIPNTQLTGTINGKPFVGWSRYRPGQPWEPDTDNVITQFALVEAALAKEVGE